MTFLDNTIELIRKQRFNPNWFWGIILNDFYLPRRSLYTFIKGESNNIQGRILDIGCGEKPYAHLFSCTEYIGIDIETTAEYHENHKTDLFYNGVELPFENNNFDAIVCFEVLEHVFEPEIMVREMLRVLKPGGSILLTTPFIWNEHEIPYDYGRYSYFGLKDLFTKNGFIISKQKRILSGFALIITLISLYIRDGQEKLKELFPKSKLGKVGRWLVYLTFRPIFMTFNIAAVVAQLLPKSDRFYFNNGLLARKTVDSL